MNFVTGTVIDNKVCHPRNNDFYMCAHAGMIVSIFPFFLFYFSVNIYLKSKKKALA